MAVYEINGTRFELPDDLEGEQLQETLMYLAAQVGQESTPEQPQAHQFGPVRENINPRSLAEDDDWLAASRIIYQMNEGQDWEGSNEDLAEYGLDLMGWFNYNLPAMAVNTNRITSAEQHQREAFLYLMDSYDNLNISWGGVGRFFKGVLADPSTYIGLGTFGLGAIGAQGGKQATKHGIRETLRRSLRVGAVAGVEGGIYAGVDNAMRQEVRIAGGQQEGYDAGQATRAVGTGVAVGMAGGTVLDAVFQQSRQLFTKRGVVNESTQTPPPQQPGSGPQASQPDAPTPPARVDAPEATADAGAAAARADVPTRGSEEVPLLEGPQQPGVPASTVREPSDIFEYTRLEDLPISRAKTDLPYERKTMQENVNKAMRLAQDLKNLHHTQVDDVIDQLRTREMTLREFEEFMLSAKLARDWSAKERAAVISAMENVTDPEQLARLAARDNELADLFSRLESLDDALGSHSGYMLRQRQEGLRLKGLPKDDPQAFARAVYKAEQSAEVRQLKRDYNARIEKAMNEGDIGEAARLITLRSLEMDEALSRAMGQKPGFIHKLNEGAISNVFSPTTLQINVASSAARAIYRPFLDAMVNNPLDAATRKQLGATYSGMAAATQAAWRGALASFRYEQPILTRDTGRLLEGQLAIQGKKGALIRIFPRLLNASDEFLSQMTYRGAISGKTAGEAYEAGLKQGLKGKALDRYVKEQVKDAVNRAYSDASHKESLGIVANKGVNLGLRGEELANYVKREVNRNHAALRHANDNEALDYVRDVLYKRSFSGTNNASKAARWYEQLVHDFPILRLMGQLFFRTPIRVFEEGMRITPGVQVIAPNFIKDLRGANGPKALVRAQGEALMSMAMLGSVMTLYAKGAITGDGAYSDWRQQRARGDSDLPEPYTIRFPDGSTWSYRNFDPLATPLKIMVNGLERYENLLMRERQGEFINKTEWDRALAALSVPTMAVAQAIRDANLMGGLDGAIKLVENISNPEERDGATLKYIGERLKWLVPNTMHKIARSNDPEIDDPATFWQMVESRILDGGSLGMYDKTTPKSYDILGNPREIASHRPMWNIFATTSEEERERGRSDTELFVMRELDRLSKETGAVFHPPYQHRMTGDLDLRRQLTEDGTETLYDRWQRYYRETEPAEILAPILEAGAPVGTRSIRGVTVRQVQQTINQLRDEAFFRLMAEEASVDERVIQTLDRRAEVESGFWDYSR